ncbi:hypothetical protein LP420_40810 [Massilia sp. B-10]|nr:hypothetical protein LP420_40810 [Massilia sp. B-10]
MKFDVAIVGSGLASLSVALHLAQTRKVAIISKSAAGRCEQLGPGRHRRRARFGRHPPAAYRRHPGHAMAACATRRPPPSSSNTAAKRSNG